MSSFVDGIFAKFGVTPKPIFLHDPVWKIALATQKEGVAKYSPVLELFFVLVVLIVAPGW
jgi:hypothetical protein